jgi:hypothetical protein
MEAKKKIEIESLGAALALVQGILPELIIEKNYGPGIIFNHAKGRFFMMYKREYYKNFKYHFPEVLKEDGKPYGWAQIMSLELLNYCAHDSNSIDWVLFVTPDGRAYKSAARLFKKFVDRYNTEVPHLKGEVAMPLDYFQNLEEEVNGIHGKSNTATEEGVSTTDKVQSSVFQTETSRSGEQKQSNADASAQSSLSGFK